MSNNNFENVDFTEEAYKFGLIGCVMVLIIPLIYIAWLINGFVLYKIWQWLVVPIFEVEQISIIGAMTIGLVVSFLNNPYHAPNNEKSPSKFLWYLIAAVSRPWCFLLMGYILSFWV